jgi:hypothetical protein
LQHVGKFSPGGAVADFLSLATAIIAGLPRRKGDGTLATFCGEVNRRKTKGKVTMKMTTFDGRRAASKERRFPNRRLEAGAVWKAPLLDARLERG